MWVDQRRYFIWLLPVGTLAVIWVMGWIGYGIYMAATEDFGDSISKQVTILVIAISLFMIGLYVCLGLYQMFFIELRHKFIVGKVVTLGNRYYLSGYYFKKTEFDGSEVIAVDEYPVKPCFGRHIATMLSWAPQTKQPNFKITLRDERVFYLPGNMTDVEGLVHELCGYR